MKKITLIFWYFSIVTCSAQVSLNVPLSGQKRTQWCWAASIEMILNYHGDYTDRQCNIRSQYGILRGEIECSSLNQCACDTNNTSSCNQQIELFTIGTTIESAKYFPKIFDTLDYSAKDTTVFNWDDIKKQIDACQPIILVLTRSDVFENQNNSSQYDHGQHAVVIDGYLDQGCDSRFILIKDPWRPCEGCQYALNYDSFVDRSASNNAITNTQLWIYDIKPKTSKKGCSCSDNDKPIVYRPVFKDMFPCPKPTPKITLTDYMTNPTRVVGNTLLSLLACFPKTVTPYTKLTFQKQAKSLKRYPFYIISSDKIADSNRYLKPFYETKRYLYHSPYYDNFEAIARYTPKASQISSCPTMQLDGFWLLESFGTCSYLCSRNDTCPAETRVLMSNYYIWVINFQIVIYTPFNYTFRRFKHKNKYYYYALDDYKDLSMSDGSYFKANKAYSEKMLLEQLRIKTIHHKP
jgi:hypothetical protein